MSSSIMAAARSMSFALGLNATRPTKDEDMLSLMRKLSPKDSGRDLIRIGGKGDGGYLLPDDLGGIKYCFSPGVGPFSEFESQLADRKINSFLADYSVESPSIMRPEFTFDKKFLGASDRGCYITLESWKDKYLKDYNDDLILQMDIEGSEYEVILNVPDKLLNQFRILVIEFHEVHRMFDPFAFKIMSAAFDKLLEFFYVVHIHPNNSTASLKKGEIEIPKLMEFTFLNKRRFTSVTPRTDFPHKLDVDIVPDAPMPLPKCWYAST